MQPSPTSSLLGGQSPRLRLLTTVLHGSVLVFLLTLGACRDPKVATYRVPKEPTAELPASKVVHGDGVDAGSLPPAANSPMQTASQPAMPTGAAPTAPDSHRLQTAAGASLTWTAPAAWQSKQASSMRKATFVIAGTGGATAELAITAFPGDVGGDAANVNRWRGQVGLEPLTDAQALASIEHLEANGLKIGLVDVVDASAPNAPHLLGAMVPFDGATWFFKVTGPDPVVASAKAAFVEFLKTVKPSATP